MLAALHVLGATPLGTTDVGCKLSPPKHSSLLKSSNSVQHSSCAVHGNSSKTLWPAAPAAQRL